MKKIIALIVMVMVCFVACDKQPQGFDVATLDTLHTIENVDFFYVSYDPDLNYTPRWKVGITLNNKCGEQEIDQRGDTLEEAMANAMAKYRCFQMIEGVDFSYVLRQAP